jgi:hypothetical protein
MAWRSRAGKVCTGASRAQSTPQGSRSRAQHQ